MRTRVRPRIWTRVLSLPSRLGRKSRRVLVAKSRVEMSRMPKSRLKLIAMHAGLECGVIGEKYPGMQMVSFGPTIVDPHSPNERVQISSVESFWNYLKLVLENM